MKFIHIADMHFDIPFTTLNKNKLGDARRLEQRKIFKEIIEYIKQNQIKYLFISGDLYEHEYIRQSTIEYINNLFTQIPDTKVFIAPGNHDPYLNNSYYNKYNWSKNVHIFKNSIEKISDEINIYGYGFANFYSPKISIENIELDENKVNILITHADLDGTTKENIEYNPLSKTALKESKFDYIALGHIHKPYYGENQKIVYPGSTISLGFDELGKHGMIVGEIDLLTKKVKTQFVELDKKEFIEMEVDISNYNSKEELIEQINSIQLEPNAYYKLILTGNRNFEIDVNYIEKYIENENIIKIKNETKVEINLEKMANENSLKGIFIKDLLNQMDETNKEKILYAIEIGLNAME